MSVPTVSRLTVLCLFAILVAAVAAPAAADVYRWVDDQGQVHFSDEPHDGAEPVDVGEPTVVDSLPAPQGTGPKDDADRGGDDSDSGTGDGAAAQTQWRIAIAAPSDEATVRDNQGKLQLVLDVRPRLSEDQRILILVDGSPYRQGPFTVTDITLSGLDRGAHELQALLRDDSGRVLARSATVTVYLHQASRLFRNR
ncbi:hypothetical protein KBTX_01388 [wastewater metagenome]|uniref:DUF4124 domain-containing protein n=2 Tax=unclassified sequences TaxID=12908 RepID=A0A5B8R7H9_9ZZZZ|nr:DUF4124 domain-containing protein [Arhodomonas sp. KWT]QEA05069.1 hypothetical protein KBTEX_01388 [uncultured organism]